MTMLHPGDRVPPEVRLPLLAVSGAAVGLPAPGRLLHLQFRRFAGCPICNLHIRGFMRRHAELTEAGIDEVAVFHSSAKSLRGHLSGMPFPLLADPDRQLYRAFGVEAGWRAVLHPRAMRAFLRGLLAHGLRLPGRGETPLGLPADFLVDAHGIVRACRYGAHAYDQWSVEEVLALAHTCGDPQPVRPLSIPQESR